MGFELIGQKCSMKIIMVHVYDSTVSNPNYTFTAKEISKLFGNSTQSSINLIRRLRSYLDITPVGEEKRDAYQIFKITSTGVNYAKRLKLKLGAESNKDVIT